MSTEIILMKGAGGALVPFDPMAAQYIAGLKAGYGVRLKATTVRNILFHRKFFAMLGVGFDAWETPETEYEGMKVEKDFEKFRKDATILAGFFTPVYNMKGEVRLEAKSISFANMEADEFERLYSAVVNVLLRKVLKNYTREDLDEVVERILQFT